MRYELAKERISKIEDKSRGNLKDRKKNEEKLRVTEKYEVPINTPTIKKNKIIQFSLKKNLST